MGDSARQFLAAADRVASLADRIDLRVIALRIEGEWRNLLTHAVLGRAADEPADPHWQSVESDHVLVRRVLLPSASLPQLISDFTAGRCVIGNEAVTYRRKDGDDPIACYADHWSVEVPGADRYGIQQGWTPTVPDGWPMLVYRGRGDTMHQLLAKAGWSEQDLDDHFHSVLPPFDGFHGVAEGLLGLRRISRSDDAAQLQVRVPMQVRFDATRTRLHGGVLSVHVLGGSEACLRAVEIGLAASSRGVLATAQTLYPSDDTEPASLWARRATIRVEDLQADTASLTLRVGGFRVDGLKLSDPSSGRANAFLSSYEAADEGLEILRRLLSVGSAIKNDSSGFERAVGRVFHLLGFQTIQMGPEGDLGNAVDVVAFDPYSDLVYVVECTLGAINAHGKLGKLIHRLGELRRQTGRTVRAVLATASPRDQIAEADMRSAAHDGIAVVASEDLEALLALALANAPTRVVAQALSKRIPPQPDRARIVGPPGIGGIGR
jgi:hypothetical protein